MAIGMCRCVEPKRSTGMRVRVERGKVFSIESLMGGTDGWLKDQGEERSASSEGRVDR